MGHDIEGWLTQNVYSRDTTPLTYENIQERLEIKEFGMKGSLEFELMETAKELTELREKLKTQYEISEDKKELMAQINEQIAIVADNCLKVAIWKWFMDLLKTIEEKLANL